MKMMYNVTYIDKNGLRTLFGPNQGRCMHATREAAEQWLASALVVNGEDKLVSICGEQARGTFRVDPFDCYDNGDVVSIYVEES